MDLILIKFLGAELVWNTSNSKIDREIFEILGHWNVQKLTIDRIKVIGCCQSTNSSTAHESKIAPASTF